MFLLGLVRCLQALGIAEYAIGFLSDDPSKRGDPSPEVLERTNWFYTDANLCGISAIALGTNAPTVLRNEALSYPMATGVPVLGSKVPVAPEKAILANCAAVREWDSNGTNFGYNPALGHVAGEFGHNDFYAVPIAAAQQTGQGVLSGEKGWGGGWRRRVKMRTQIEDWLAQ